MASPFNETHIQYDGHYFNETLLSEYNYSQSIPCLWPCLLGMRSLNADKHE